MNKKNYIGNYNGTDLFYEISQYLNGRMAVMITCTDEEGYEEDYADLTINLPDVDLPSDVAIDLETALKKYAFLDGDLDEDFKKFLREKNVISDPIKTVPYNFGQYELVEILIS